MRTEAHQRSIDQVAILFPYLEIDERMDWYWKLQPCGLAELTINIPTFQDRIAAMQQERLDEIQSGT